jgi:pimeloyl-ACP methyl ester carboxylesterase
LFVEREGPLLENRQDIQFISEGLKCAGWFYQVPGLDQAPCIILAHGFCGVKELRLDAYAEAFVEAGYHALVFDYRHFGASEGEPRLILDIQKQHQDWRAAIRFAKGLPGVDSHRIALWGTSFSGGHVLEIAAKDQDPDIAAVISQAPHMNGFATAAASGPLQSIRLGTAALHDLANRMIGRSPYYVRAFGFPGDLAAMTAPDVVEGVKKLYPPGFEPDERVAARIFLHIGFYSPGRLAKRLGIPWLVQVAANDLTTTVNPAVKAAKKAPKGELLIYPCGHFDVYVQPQFLQTVGDQIRFLKKSLAMRLVL